MGARRKTNETRKAPKGNERMNLNIFKHAVFSILGFVILLCLIAYGTEALFGTNATYLTATSYTTSYGATFDKYSWDIISYTRNLTKNWWHAIEEGLNINNLIYSYDKIWWASKGDGEWWEQILKLVAYIVNFFANVANFLAFIVNVLLILPIQLVIVILIYAFTAVGIDIDNFWLGQGLTWILNNLWIPYAS